jgi:hypothetical protein
MYSICAHVAYTMYTTRITHNLYAPLIFVNYVCIVSVNPGASFATGLVLRATLPFRGQLATWFHSRRPLVVQFTPKLTHTPS